VPRGLWPVAWLYYVEVGRYGPLYPTDSEIWMPMEGNLTYISFANDFGPVNMSKLYRFCITLSRVMEVPMSGRRWAPRRLEVC